MTNQYQPIKVTLQEAKPFDDKPQTALIMRPPTTNDVIHSQQLGSRILADGSKHVDEAEAEAHLFANLTGTTREFIGSLAFYDYSQLGRAYDCFLLPVPQYAARCALLFPGSVASHSQNSEASVSQNSTTG
ncbi:phage tail assembly protein [Photobacterium galatheae]|uniref:Phage tail assembly protein n=1 Tax=Photobacterium galatheae TaxID=1654360 RepID=A0A066RUL2_9GAMM|nr:phage tail assembly protein [Photobacterium galatheae]KDM91392.1 hypothetical protein EA58_12595 [Photobacterium galatheae]MCM0151651.1 phage tail assembly protein [Photobacterium galatheae]